MSKILVSDLDGTIYIQNKVSLSDEKAICKFSKTNCFILATGRNFRTFSNFESKFKIPYDYLILCNGALILNKYKNILYSNKMDIRVFQKELINVLTECGVKIALSISNDFECFYYKDVNYSNYKNIVTKFPRLVNCICIEFENTVEAQAVFNKLKDLNFHISLTSRYIDVYNKNISKYTAIKKLVDNGCVNSSYFAIGDSFNDIELLKEASKKYILKNCDLESLIDDAIIVNNLEECIKSIETNYD